MAKIAVIGSVHLDVRAQADADRYEKVEDVVGAVEYAIGGCAYNVAWNLVHNEKLLEGRTAPDVVLLSAIASDTLDGHAILAKTTASRLKVVQLGSVAFSSGYVVHIQASPGTQGTRKAVTASAVERVEIEDRRIRRHIKRSDVVYVDSNLSTAGLAAVVLACREEGIPLIVAVASDDKAPRVAEALAIGQISEKHPCVVTMNVLEAAILGCANIDSKNDFVALRKKLHATVLVVTRGANGWAVCSGDDYHKVDAPKVPGPVLPSGAGDALSAALCLQLAEHGIKGLLPNALAPVVDRTLPVILKVATATPGASDFKSVKSGLDPNSASAPALVLTVLTAAIVAAVGFAQGLRLAMFVGLFLLICSAGGALGSLVRPVWIKYSKHSARDDSRATEVHWEQVVLAATAAVSAVFITFGLQFAWISVVQMPADIFNVFATQPLRPAMVGGAIGLLAGFGADRYFSWVSKKVIEDG
ncbi:MAG TPA: PfkB family carbohydrate kinase [Steroidobacteraceae bacterium]|nr:PfkB family carbohydrate kinase [Steroidobacteraceae bacterium]